MQSQGFREELFTQREHFEEGPLRDRKEEMPNLKHNQNKAEFLRDVISLANSARFRGRPAYLLFGINDAMQICGVEESLEPYVKLAQRKAGERDMNAARFEECLWQEVIEHIMLYDLIGPYVDQQLAGNCELKRGLIDGRQCAYLLIPPIPAPHLYCSQKPVEGKDEVLMGVQECWIRIGESKYDLRKTKVLPNQEPYCHPAAQVPHPFPSQWREYFTGLTAHLQEATVIPGYQELFTDTGDSLSEVVDGFLDNNKESLLVIVGKAGMGKSAFLERLVHRLASDCLYETEQNIASERFDSPNSLMPMYISLQGWAAPDLQLDAEVMNWLNGKAHFWDGRPEMPERMLDYTDCRWVICFDGLDEIWTLDGRARFLKSLNHFQRSHPNVKVILSTRPDLTFAGLNRIRVVHLDALTEEQIESYLSVLAKDKQLDEIRNFLRSESELRELCGIPAFLESAVATWIGDVTEEGVTGYDLFGEVVVPIRKGGVLDNIYRHIWDRERDRRPVLSHEPDQWFDETGQLAATMDGGKTSIRRREAMKCIGSEQGLNWVFSLGVLGSKPRSGWVHFVSDITKAYFAASFLLPFIQEEDYQCPLDFISQGRREFWESALAILRDLVYMDVTELDRKVSELSD